MSAYDFIMFWHFFFHYDFAMFGQISYVSVNFLCLFEIVMFLKIMFQ